MRRHVATEKRDYRTIVACKPLTTEKLILAVFIYNCHLGENNTKGNAQFIYTSFFDHYLHKTAVKQKRKMYIYWGVTTVKQFPTEIFDVINYRTADVGDADGKISIIMPTKNKQAVPSLCKGIDLCNSQPRQKFLARNQNEG